MFCFVAYNTAEQNNNIIYNNTNKENKIIEELVEIFSDLNHIQLDTNGITINNNEDLVNSLVKNVPKKYYTKDKNLPNIMINIPYLKIKLLCYYLQLCSSNNTEEKYYLMNEENNLYFIKEKNSENNYFSKKLVCSNIDFFSLIKEIEIEDMPKSADRKKSSNFSSLLDRANESGKFDKNEEQIMDDDEKKSNTSKKDKDKKTHIGKEQSDVYKLEKSFSFEDGEKSQKKRARTPEDRREKKISIKYHKEYMNILYNSQENLLDLVPTQAKDAYILYECYKSLRKSAQKKFIEYLKNKGEIINIESWKDIIEEYIKNEKLSSHTNNYFKVVKQEIENLEDKKNIIIQIPIFYKFYNKIKESNNFSLLEEYLNANILLARVNTSVINKIIEKNENAEKDRKIFVLTEIVIIILLLTFFLSNIILIYEDKLYSNSLKTTNNSNEDLNSY